MKNKNTTNNSPAAAGELPKGGTMSYVKRWIEDRVDEIAQASGYSWEYIMEIAMDMFEEEGGIDFDLIEAIAMEHDF